MITVRSSGIPLICYILPWILLLALTIDCRRLVSEFLPAILCGDLDTLVECLPAVASMGGRDPESFPKRWAHEQGRGSISSRSNLSETSAILITQPPGSKPAINVLPSTFAS